MMTDRYKLIGRYLVHVTTSYYALVVRLIGRYMLLLADLPPKLIATHCSMLIIL